MPFGARPYLAMDDGRSPSRTGDDHEVQDCNGCGGVHGSGGCGIAEQMQITTSAERTPMKGPAETFTGDVQVNPWFPANEHQASSGALVEFTAGARSAWHIHPAGQTLVVMSGTGWVQERSDRPGSDEPRRYHQRQRWCECDLDGSSHRRELSRLRTTLALMIDGLTSRAIRRNTPGRGLQPPFAKLAACIPKDRA